MEFSKGDAVRLKGQTKVMTVEEVDTDISCCWHNESGVLERENFDPELLEKVVSGVSAFGPKIP